MDDTMRTLIKGEVAQYYTILGSENLRVEDATIIENIINTKGVSVGLTPEEVQELVEVL